MAKHEAVTTQSAHPWRATVRTIFAAVIALAALAPLIYSSAAQQSPELATGAVGGVLVAAGAITRIMAIPGVEAFLQRFLPFLSAAQRDDPLVTVKDVQVMTGTEVQEISKDLQDRARSAKRAEGTQPVVSDDNPSVADQVHYTGE
ncbi:hypothetical protein [Glutamicibacter sp. NPDC087344]|uniref:hypothetical protein n=1 Tax=Glutamicibacter sp. NPDC087344 TaxID=3363994 RepID=UPI0038042E83